MLFNSIEYLIFLPIVFLIYWYLNSKSLFLRNLFLLTSSYIFYGWWDVKFLILISISIVIDYGCGIFIEKSKGKSKRLLFLWISIISNFGILFAFKYFGFFVDSWMNLLQSLGYNSEYYWTLNIILPVGISFYTFQSLSYTIDVYKREIKAEKSFVVFSAFVSFFPQLVAGPIERAKNLLPQINSHRKFSYPQSVSGLRLILWGLFKKIVIADSLAPQVDAIFSNYSNFHGGILILGVLYFAFQIYCDFSGYSDIAVGTAKLFGIKLMVNFKFPYFSKNIGEFWKRWHISLTTWFRDYLYIPLGGSRASQIISLRNVFIVFIISGLWHGANWTFLAWGLTHALFYIPFFLLVKKKSKHSKIQYHLGFLPKLKDVLKMLLTFTLVCFGWVFFRSESIQNAFEMILIILFSFELPLNNYSDLKYIFIILSFDWLLRNDNYGNLAVLDKLNRIFRWILYLIICIWVMSSLNTFEAPFIYFQF